MTSVTLCCHSVFAFQPAGARDVDCRAERLRDQMARLAVLGGVPVLGLVLELHHRRPPTNTYAGSIRMAVRAPGIRYLAHLHASV
jgi:hypothetical protein